MKDCRHCQSKQHDENVLCRQKVKITSLALFRSELKIKAMKKDNFGRYIMVCLHQRLNKDYLIEISEDYFKYLEVGDILVGADGIQPLGEYTVTKSKFILMSNEEKVNLMSDKKAKITFEGVVFPYILLKYKAYDIYDNPCSLPSEINY
jgi:hypothetical protein